MHPDGGPSTRERILVAAETLFAEAGYHGTRLHDIARCAGVQKASLFHHFASKGQLYRAVLDQGFGESELTIRRILEEGRPPLATVTALAGAWVDLVARHPARTRILLRQSIGDAPAGPWASGSERVLRPVVDLVAGWQRAGVFAAMDPLAFVLGVVGTVVFLFASAPMLTAAWDAGGTGGVARIKEHVALLVTRALAAPGSVPARSASSTGHESARLSYE